LAQAFCLPDFSISIKPLWLDGMATQRQLSDSQSCDANPYWGAVVQGARDTPDAVALRIISAQGSERPPLTFATLQEAGLAAAAFLHDLGVVRGSIVLTAVANTEVSVALSIGIARLGAVWAPADQDLTVDQITRLFNLYAPVVAVLADDTVDAMAPVEMASTTKTLKLPSWQALLACDAARLPAEMPVEDSSPALMLLTSGTTGIPKSVVTPTSTLRTLAGGAGRQELFDVDGQDRPESMIYFGSPAWISYSMSFLKAMSNQATLILGQGYVRDIYFDAVVRHKASYLFFWPEVVVDFVVLPEALQQRLAAFVRTVTYGGARTPRAALLKLIAALPDTAITQGYGSSEFLPITRLGPDDHAAVRRAPTDEQALRRLESAGRCLVEVRVVDEAGEAVPEGTTGSIQANPTGAATFLEYYKNPAATAAKWTADGWYITGDLGRLDADGYLQVDGRDAETIVLLSGDNVYPNDVESVIAELPGVVEVAVVRVVTEDKAVSEVGAFVRIEEASTVGVAEVRAQCQRRLGQTWSHPTHIFVQTEKLPRNRNGKCMKPLLSDMASTSLKKAVAGGA